MKKERVKYFHLSPDDKFFDYIIDNCESTAPGESAYIIRNSRGSKLQYVKNREVVVTKNVTEILQELSRCSKVEKVYIHFLTSDAIPFVLNLPKHLEVYWIFWGADGYNLPGLEKNLYKGKTKDTLYNLGILKPQSWLDKIRDSAKLLFRYGNRAQLVKAVKRVDYCATWVQGDFDLVKSFNHRMKYTYFNNNSIEQIIEESSDEMDISLPENLKHKDYIILGNSGHPTNNHIEAFEFVMNLPDYNVVVPVSYGNKKYIDLINKMGASILGDRFIPLFEFLPKESYNAIIRNAKFLIMNHSRQQAANNILTALWYGIPVYMDSNNTLFQTLKKWGLGVEDINTISLNPISSTSLLESRRLLSQNLGRNMINQSFNKLLKASYE